MTILHLTQLLLFGLLLPTEQPASFKDESEICHPSIQSADFRRPKYTLQWHLPVGCDFSGFFVELLGFVPGLVKYLGFDRLRISGLGYCKKDMLTQLSPLEAKLISKLQSQAGPYSRSSGGVDPNLDERPIIAIQHVEPCRVRRASTPYADIVVARSMTETSVIPKKVVECTVSRKLDALLVPTVWGKEVYEQSGITLPIHVVNEAVDSTFFDRKKSQHFERKKFTFVSVFKWEYRKGWDILLESFGREFKQTENVRLLLRTWKPRWEKGNPNILLQAEEFLKSKLRKSLSDVPEIEWLRYELSREEMRDLLAKSDAFVLPTRGEGFGLPLAEACSMELPVIATMCSGPLEYLTKDNSFLIDSLGIDKQGFCRPSVRSLREQLRRVFMLDQESRAQIGRKARNTIVNRFSPEIVTKQLAKVLRVVAEK